MVFSVKANKKRIIAVIVIIAILACGVMIVPKMVTAPMKHYGETSTQRMDFIKSFGWIVAEEPLDTRDVTIPKTFSDVYAKYNVMQKAQGFDILPYSGMNCRQFIYRIENYPNTDREIHLTLLVYENLIIGGDISCAEVDGFMHGFAADSVRYGETTKKVGDTAPPSPTASSQAPSQASSQADDTLSSQAAEKTGAEIIEEDSADTDVDASVEDDVDTPVDTSVEEGDFPTD